MNVCCIERAILQHGNRLIDKNICYLFAKSQAGNLKSIPKIDIRDLSASLAGNEKRRQIYVR